MRAYVKYLGLGEVNKAALLLREVLRGPLLVLAVALVLEHLDLIGAAQIIAATGRDVWHGSLAAATRRHHTTIVITPRRSQLHGTVVRAHLDYFVIPAPSGRLSRLGGGCGCHCHPRNTFPPETPTRERGEESIQKPDGHPRYSPEVLPKLPIRGRRDPPVCVCCDRTNEHVSSRLGIRCSGFVCRPAFVVWRSHGGVNTSTPQPTAARLVCSRLSRAAALREALCRRPDQSPAALIRRGGSQ